MTAPAVVVVVAADIEGHVGREIDASHLQLFIRSSANSLKFRTTLTRTMIVVANIFNVSVTNIGLNSSKILHYILLSLLVSKYASK